jgi:hypothetical protein
MSTDFAGLITKRVNVPLRENNLIGAQHIRYGGYGGIAYHHISDSYIARRWCMNIPGCNCDGWVARWMPGR